VMQHHCDFDKTRKKTTTPCMTDVSLGTTNTKCPLPLEKTLGAALVSIRLSSLVLASDVQLDVEGPSRVVTSGAVDLLDCLHVCHPLARSSYYVLYGITILNCAINPLDKNSGEILHTTKSRESAMTKWCQSQIPTSITICRSSERFRRSCKRKGTQFGERDS